MKVHRPQTLDAALRLMSEAKSPLVPIAGGTDLLVSWHHHAKNNLELLDLSCLRSELAPTRSAGDELVLGALTTYWDILTSREVSASFPLLAESAQQVGAIQIQTRGTWAGNIGNGSPAADGVPVLMAYDAMVVLASVRGAREVALDLYWTGYKQSVRSADELIVAIRLPVRQRTFEWFHKVGARSAQTITKVGVAVVCDDRGWRVCANSVSPFVCRCRNLEAALGAGKQFESPGEIREVLKSDISPIDDLRSTAEYRAIVLARLLFHRLREEGVTPRRKDAKM